MLSSHAYVKMRKKWFNSLVVVAIVVVVVASVVVGGGSAKSLLAQVSGIFSSVA